MLGYFKVLLLLSFTGADFGNGLIDRKGKGEWKPGLLGDPMCEFISPFIASMESIHSCNVKVKFINAGFFNDGSFLLNNFGDVM
ncbi:hypothetical protein D3C84_1175270 [compost metagenome]